MLNKFKLEFKRLFPYPILIILHYNTGCLCLTLYPGICAIKKNRTSFLAPSQSFGGFHL